VRALLVRRFAARMVASMSGPRVRGGAGSQSPRARQAYDVEGTAADAPPDGLDAGRRTT
jgi:hypothetical protein